jgi:hypothetical protein
MNKMKRLGAMAPFRGPIAATPPTANDVVQIYTANQGSYGSDATGKIAYNFSTSRVTAANDWASLASLYREYRIRGYKLTWIPLYNGSPSGTLSYGVGAMMPHHQVAAATPTSAPYGSFGSKPWSVTRQTSVEWRAESPRELDWLDTTAGIDYGGVKFYCDGLSNTTSYGVILEEWILELRYRQ